MRASVAAIVLVLLASNGAAQITDLGVYEDWNNPSAYGAPPARNDDAQFKDRF